MAQTPADFRALDAILQNAIAANDGAQIPGAVVVIGHHGRVFYRKAFGWRSLEPEREPMTVDTVFDVASLTKCLVTATAVMQLVESGRLSLNDPVAQWLPGFAANGKQEITVRQLLTHFSGLRTGRSRSPPPAPAFATPISISSCSASWSRSSRAWRSTSMRRSIFSSRWR
jgi:CubicO group peptidase (beta-lactamase class C family)